MTMSSTDWKESTMSDRDNCTTPGPLNHGNEHENGTAADIVRSFLNAMQRRELMVARSFLSPDFTMTFPGDARFTELEELIAWGKQRYGTIAKSYQQFDEFGLGDATVVYCIGTLHGALLNGSRFQDIRFIDRFTVRDNKLLDQQVWNDMGEVLGSV